MRSSRAIYQHGLKDAVRAHLRTLAGGGHSPHQIAQANAVLAASKRHLLQQARKARLASRRGVSAGAVAGAAGVGGLAGFTMPGRSKWEDVPPYGA
jgi:hypothetical protein